MDNKGGGTLGRSNGGHARGCRSTPPSSLTGTTNERVGPHTGPGRLSARAGGVWPRQRDFIGPAAPRTPDRLSIG
eukprot:758841-Hanusia_phi.AAC.1